MREARIPLGIKIGFTAWVAAWVPVYLSHYGARNFLWFCDIANFVLAAGLWLESPLLVSWQAVSVLAVQLVWTFDLLAYVALGSHPIGAAAYMSDPSHPLLVRGFSLFHMAVPILMIWGLARLGYDRRALPAQIATAWIVLPLSMLFGPEADINWVWGPFDRRQDAIAPGLYLALCMAGYPLLLYAPSHWVLKRIFPTASAGTEARRGASPAAR